MIILNFKYICFVIFIGLIACDPLSEAEIVNTTGDSIVFICSFNSYSNNSFTHVDSNGNYNSLIIPYDRFIFLRQMNYCINPKDMPDYLEIRKPRDTLIYRGKETIYQLFDFTNPGKKKRKKCDGEWIYYIR